MKPQSCAVDCGGGSSLCIGQSRFFLIARPGLRLHQKLFTLTPQIADQLMQALLRVPKSSWMGELGRVSLSQRPRKRDDLDEHLKCSLVVPCGTVVVSQILSRINIWKGYTVLYVGRICIRGGNRIQRNNIMKLGKE